MASDRASSSGRVSVADELAALRRIVAVLDKLDTETQDSIASWVWDRYHRTDDDLTSLTGGSGA